jgi:nitrate/nitrite transporter NarK
MNSKPDTCAPPLIDPAPGSLRRWAIVIVGSVNFMVSMFYRSAVAVIAPSLAADLALDASQIGAVSAVFYYAFAAGQIPLGIALDRLGPRFTTFLLSLAAVSGGLLFAAGSSATHLIIARILLGIGMSGNLMVVLALLSSWFPVNRFAFLSGLIVAVGVVGSLIAATPLALINLWIGWRAGFVLFTAFNAVIVAVFLVIMRDGPPGAPDRGPCSPSLFGELKILIRRYDYWAISLSNFVRYGYFAALQGLWLGPFLISGLGWDEITAGNGILVLSTGYMIGLPLGGFLSDRVFYSRKKVILTGLVLYWAVTTGFLMNSSGGAIWPMYIGLFGLGLLAAPGNVLYAHMKELLPANMVSQAMTAVNLFTVLGAGLMTQMIGLTIPEIPPDSLKPELFVGLWYTGSICLAAVSLLYSRVPDAGAFGPSTRAAK